MHAAFRNNKTENYSLRWFQSARPKTIFSSINNHKVLLLGINCYFPYRQQLNSWIILTSVGRPASGHCFGKQSLIVITPHYVPPSYWLPQVIFYHQHISLTWSRLDRLFLKFSAIVLPVAAVQNILYFPQIWSSHILPLCNVLLLILNQPLMTRKTVCSHW